MARYTMADGNLETFGTPQSIEAAVSHDPFFGPEVAAQLDQIAGATPAAPTLEQRARRRWMRHARTFLRSMRNTSRSNELVAIDGLVSASAELARWEGAPARAYEMLTDAEIDIGNRWMRATHAAEER